MRFKGLRVSRGGCSFGAGLVTGLSRMASTACLTDCTRQPAVAKEAFSRPKELSLPGSATLYVWYPGGSDGSA